MDPARGRVHPEAPRGLWLLSLHGVGWPAEKPADHPWGCRDCNRPEVCVGGPGASGRWLGVGVGDLGSMKGNQAGGHGLAWGHPRVTRGGGSRMGVGARCLRGQGWSVPPGAHTQVTREPH